MVHIAVIDWAFRLLIRYIPIIKTTMLDAMHSVNLIKMNYLDIASPLSEHDANINNPFG